jgi:hypothetical protein
VAAVHEERKPIRTPADLATVIHVAAKADIDAAATLALSAPPDVPLPTHSLALLLRRLFTTRSITAVRGLLDKLHPSGEDGCPRPNSAPRRALLALADAVCRRGELHEISRRPQALFLTTTAVPRSPQHRNYHVMAAHPAEPAPTPTNRRGLPHLAAQAGNPSIGRLPDLR